MRLFRFTLFGWAVLLTACSSMSPRSIERIELPRSDSVKEAPIPQSQAKRSGGYYLDDGPGDSHPPDFDQIPDAVPKDEPAHRGTAKPYVVFGRKYVPISQPARYKDRGTASWYGRKFHGQRTANGEIYDMYAMTAAHPTLPIPSYARVTNLQNNKSVIVRINDRGPFLHGRIIDLSFVAAWKLGYAQTGSAPVEVELIHPGDETLMMASAETKETADKISSEDLSDPITNMIETHEQKLNTELPAEQVGNGLFLQLGAFANNQNAESFREKILPQLAWLLRPIELYLKDGLYRVRIGPYANRGEARDVAERIRSALEFTPVIVRH